MARGTLTSKLLGASKVDEKGRGGAAPRPVVPAHSGCGVRNLSSQFVAVHGVEAIDQNDGCAGLTFKV
jgi:hypothetical protein